MIAEVAFAEQHSQTLLAIDVPEGTTIEQAINLSNILKKHPQINLSTNQTGIFGKKFPLNTVLREKDRVEIYRPLIANPKEMRKLRAKEGKSMRKNKDLSKS